MGSRFNAVIMSPSHPANASGWRTTVWLAETASPTDSFAKKANRADEDMFIPAPVSPGIKVEYLSPIKRIGKATARPASGPAIPVSKSAFLFFTRDFI